MIVSTALNIILAREKMLSVDNDKVLRLFLHIFVALFSLLSRELKKQHLVKGKYIFALKVELGNAQLSLINN
jgi:hypothetical protein